MLGMVGITWVKFRCFLFSFGSSIGMKDVTEGRTELEGKGIALTPQNGQTYPNSSLATADEFV